MLCGDLNGKEIQKKRGRRKDDRGKTEKEGKRKTERVNSIVVSLEGRTLGR